MTHEPRPPEPEAAIAAFSNRRILWLLAAGTLIVSVLWRLPAEAQYIGHRTAELFLTLVLAMSFTYLLRPPVNFLTSRVFRGRYGRTWATLVTFIVCGAALWLATAISLRAVTHDVQDLWGWFVAQDKQAQHEMIARWQTALGQAIAPIREYLPPGFDFDVKSIAGATAIRAAPHMLDWLNGARTHVGFVVELLLLPVLVFYFLSDGPEIRREARLLVPIEYRAQAARVAAHVDRVLDGYIRGQIIMCLIAWIAVTIGLSLLGVKHAVTLGLIAGITRAVPVIGPLLGAIPLVLVCLITTHSLPITATLLVGFIVMHFVESKVLLPKIVGHEVDLHPVSVIIVLLIGLEFCGVMGVFLAVPVAATLKALLAEWHESRQPRSDWPAPHFDRIEVPADLPGRVDSPGEIPT